MSRARPATRQAPASADSGLPTGTVTFLFTDIAGSTQLLSDVGQGYQELLARHNAIVRSALSEHDGMEVSTEGDALFAVFRSAPQAVAAAVSAQRALAAEDWPGDTEVLVRMGLHSGEGRLGGDNYVGLDVNRAARIAAAGHGGQILLSEATRALVSHDAPAGVAFRDLGQHRLKDLPSPEHLWQAEVDGLEQEFPPPRSLDARPNNLPVSPTTLVGRERELAQVRELVKRSRLLTLTGVGGTGKTRLALAAAHSLLADFADGCYFVAVQDATDERTVAAAIVSALGVRETAVRSAEASIKRHLRERQLLLVLDNFEHVLSAAPLVAELLTEAAGLRVIVTSRELLHLSGEHGFEVPPLALPDPDRLPPLGVLSQYEAVRLFIERAAAARDGFSVTNDNAPAVAEICARLDGLPLAIELAAARVRLLSPQAILDRLERRLPLLTGGPRDAPARQRTLRDAISWSHELLDEPERELFARLSVFAGGWTVEAAEEVCNPRAELGRETLDGLASLADKSLVRPAEVDGEPRFVMLQVIREYAAEQLQSGPSKEDIHRRHAYQMLALVEQAEPQLMLTDVRRWQQRLRREEDNLRAALRWAIRTGDAELGMRVAGAAWRFWLFWARLREAREWLEAVLALPAGSQPTLARAKALSGLASVHYWQGQNQRLGELYDEALAIYRRLGDDGQQGEALFNSAWGALSRGEMPLALERAGEALEAHLRAGDEASAANVRAWLTVTPYFTGGGGNLAQTLAAVQEAIAVNRAAGRLHEATDWYGAVAQARFAAGDPAGAADAARDALGGFHEIGNAGMYAMGAKAISVFELAAGGDPRRVAKLAAAAERLFDELGGQLQMIVRFGNPLEEARRLLSEDEYEAAVSEGRAMTADEAVAYALEPARSPG